MTVLLQVVAVTAVLVVVALLAGGLIGGMSEPEPDAAGLGLPPDGPLGADDVRSVRFALALRGYRMSEVDQVLDRLAAEIERRDIALAALRTRPGGVAAPAAGAAEGSWQSLS